MAIWAAVLVPMWLRRHDAVTESRSVDRFSTAMRVLSRRSPHRDGSRYVVMAPRPPGDRARQGSGPRRFPVQHPVAGGLPRPREAQAELRERRARVLLVLAAVAGLTLLSALVGLTAWTLHLLADLALAGYVVHLRLQVVKTAAAPRGRPVVAPSAEPAYVEAAPAPAASTATAASADVEGEQPGAAVVAAGATDPPLGRGWQPVPVPLPTYVTAPVVPRRPRERLLPAPTAEPFEPDDAEFEVLFERRWAVND